MVNLFRWKSIRVTFGLREEDDHLNGLSSLPFTHQTKRPIFTLFSKTRMPVGVKPRRYSNPSLPITVCKSTPYISNHRALFKYCISQSAGVKPLIEVIDNVRSNKAREGKELLVCCPVLKNLFFEFFALNVNGKKTKFRDSFDRMFTMGVIA